ncbi:D-glycero-beta-D-manno-heptose-7-phosphate kinase [Pyruvatibacter mobilis]|uniref:Bifunctional protein HldE n=1 Tax=Pyruvatibacter mobilis TaxID=1712261 RepID=A0A845Q9Z7_9HYPH|nr:D-glycero-beta-D-manno-heptose-7-phosphate kinase [Pyruvatibacter mobilis]NBG95010.1 D-glycero-beta-D-manno-heptose-7-phosphate kinase [Pyruvatibacter mobilis]QJD76913.1 D-glycero-beta-D-manno-heptose-7-phosphate kinase [Pyruvatibacter mobilis]
MSDELDILARFPQGRVVCLGDIMLDRYVYGRVDRISPEAPIPVIAVEREAAMLGGVGNVARNVASLGGTAGLLATIGDDEAGREVLRLISEEERIEPDLITDIGRATTVKTRFVAGAQQLLRADQEVALPLSGESVDAIVEAAREDMANAGVIVLSDYAKGCLSDNVLQAIIGTARDMGLPVIVDPKSADFSRYSGATMIKPNLKELALATGMPCGTDAEVLDAATEALAHANADAILVTRSQAGMTLVMRAPSGEGIEAHHFPARALEVFDVSGAGDTVLATLGLAIAAGADLPQAAAIANAAAGLVVAKIGTAVVYPGELTHALHEADVNKADQKICTLTEALDRVERWRAQGQSVGFTNGCFDLIHPGHLSLLRQSRAECDRLVVGLNSDSSVKQLKGESRPLQGELARALVLASLEDVDMVVIFSDETPLTLISTLKPDVLVKGADYTVETVVGADIVQANGGRVVLAELVAGQSTTNTIARMTGS